MRFNACEGLHPKVNYRASETLYKPLRRSLY